MDEQVMRLPLNEKIAKSKDVIIEAVKKFGEDKIAVAFTGGKDSTVLLHMIRDTFGGTIPIRVMFVDTGKHFSEVYKFKDDFASKWSFQLINAKNIVVLNSVIKGVVQLQDLPPEMRKELKKINWDKDAFRIALDREPCCHLLKTVATNQALQEYDLKALMAGIRWDEQEARSDETYFSPRANPPHTRVHPILHFKWKEIWQYLKLHNLPHNPLYDKGFTSLGCFTCTTPNPEGEVERAGRSQDKEQTMRRLRALGYF
jgi:phosphoadenosine phosphosulfate reductase